MNKILHTKYGTAKIDNSGYYRITSGKEGNHRKLLHRLIAADYFGEWIDEPDPNGDQWVIHHVNGDKTCNCVLNLEPIPYKDHTSLHHTGKTHSEESKKKMSEVKKGENNYWYGKQHSDETKKKMSEAHKGKTHSEESKKKMSESKKGENHPLYGKHHSEETKIKMAKSHNNNSGYLKVSKVKNKNCKQGFRWTYSYYENGKRKQITSVSLEKLEEKVKARGLKWYKFKKND